VGADRQADWVDAIATRRHDTNEIDRDIWIEDGTSIPVLSHRPFPSVAILFRVPGITDVSSEWAERSNTLSRSRRIDHRANDQDRTRMRFRSTRSNESNSKLII
jgi:hypothetical protein